MLPLVSKTMTTESGARELLDLLLHLVFKHLEIFLVQAGHEPAHRIGDRAGNQHQRGVDADIGATLHHGLRGVGIFPAHSRRNGSVIRLLTEPVFNQRRSEEEGNQSER
jgi:hypothetical protein